MLFAHSSDSKRGIPAQDYAAHIGGVVKLASQAADATGHYALHDGELLRKIVPLAAEFHDLGKLDVENQDVLSGKRKARHLPVQHTDAGTAYLLDKIQVAPGAALVRSHHIGLPDFIEEQNRKEKNVLRDDRVLERVNRTLPELVRMHEETRLSAADISPNLREVMGDASLFFRIALSCLADGDHADTAIHYQDQSADEPFIALRPVDRLAALDRYVESLKQDNDRSRLRSEVYAACRDTDIPGNIVSCDSPVGTGKTTAVMAHLLAQAQKRKLRRIIVVLPFTNIITQSVKVYRDALVLPGEDPKLVVAELHHRAEFEDIHSRKFTALWKAPIIVTTAVTFFETLASNTPATLRRLHNLPGSAVFIDESHAALPAKLLPLAWRWIKGFAREWACYWVLASGSLNRFWKIEEFDKEKSDIPEIMPVKLRDRLAKYEQGRIIYRFNDIPLGERDLVEWVASLPGPRIVILNTVQSAAVLAREHERCFQRSSVEHLSTALTPSDRDRTLARIKSRLADMHDTEWTLVATSCIEAGVDISFRTGVREAASLVSLLQTAGRVNRHNHISAENVWTILLKESDFLKKNPGMSDSSKVLIGLISEGCSISPDLCTNALKREIRLAGTFSSSLLKSEEGLRFPQVEKNFHVIATDTRTVVVDQSVVEKMETHRPVDWRDIQKTSVQIWGYRLDNLRIPEVSGHPGIYKWNYAYDDFIGYMAGILKMTNDPNNFVV
ncbi:MAG: DEAD/DEAH box helicase family protein [Syntrophales bacterium]|nr:DEAD/DEAH box helicase family protein [Syntrophales bacterium]